MAIRLLQPVFTHPFLLRRNLENFRSLLLMTRLRAILFDFDGLILDTENACYGGWRWTFEKHGLEYSLEEFQRIVGTDATPRILFEQRVGSAVDWATIDPERREYERTLGRDMEIKPGVLALLEEAMENGWKRAIVSSSPDDWVLPHLERRNALRHFDAFICRGDAAHAKPAPDLYREALRRLGVSGPETVALEDSHNGLLAAKRAGIWCVAVPNDITRSMDFSQADLVVENLEKLNLRALAARLGIHS